MHFLLGWCLIFSIQKILLSYAEGDVLEVGIGTGTNLQYYPSTIKSLIGIDWSNNMLVKAFENIDDWEKKDLIKIKNYKLVNADCLDMPFKDDSFDVVIDTLTLQSVYDL